MNGTDNSVLIVEDDPSTRFLLLALMKRNGLPSSVASNAQEAMAVLGERSFGLIILDLMLPGVTGHEVIAFLRSEGRSERVIVCTAAGPPAIAEIDRSVVNAVVQKPFDVEELTAIVMQTLKEPK